MATKYARASATDDNGNGTVDADSGAGSNYAFKTINHALNGTNKIAAGDTLNIASGNYTGEDSGSGFLVIPPYATTTTIQGTPGNATLPVISSLLSAGGQNVYMGSSGVQDKVVLRNLHFKVPAGKLANCVTSYSSGSIFDGCTFETQPSADAYKCLTIAVYTGTNDPVTLTDCTFTCTSAEVTDTNQGISIGPGAGRIIPSVTITRCTVNTPGTCIILLPTTQGELRNVTITDCSFTMQNSLTGVFATRFEKVNRASTSDYLIMSNCSIDSPQGGMTLQSIQGVEIKDTSINANATYTLIMGGDSMPAGSPIDVVANFTRCNITKVDTWTDEQRQAHADAKAEVAKYDEQIAVLEESEADQSRIKEPTPGPKPNVPAPTPENYNGSISCNTTTAAITSITQYGGELIIDGKTNAVTALTIYSGTAYYNTAGTCTLAVVGAAGTLDFRRDMRAKTVTQLNCYDGASVYDTAAVLTLTNGIDLIACGIEDCKLELGKNKTWTPSAI